MDFAWDEAQEAYRAAVARFAENELNDDLLGRDARGEFSSEAWKRCAAFGLPGLPIPAEYGGEGADPLKIALALEALGYACRDNGLVFALNAHMWAAEVPILVFGREAQKRRYLPGMCDGSLIGGQAMSEPDSGSDAFSLSTFAQRQGDRYVINGSKMFITNAPVANLLIVFATTDRSKGFGGLTAFLVDRDTPGLLVGEPVHKMGLRTSMMSEVVFSDCVVPEDAVLGPPGGGMSVFNTAMDWERSFILASAVGVMQRHLERCIAYARERRQFGKPIGKYQAVSHRIVDMSVRLRTARLLLYELAWLRTHMKSTTLEAATLKLYLSECLVESSMDALYVHGGYGYMAEYELERDVRDSIASRLYSGTSDMQRNIIAARLGL